jgi:hemoglobin-like flavoprotein
MEQKTVDLVQSSFKKVLPIADTAVEIFYEKLFIIDPSLKAMFPKNEELMSIQRNKLRDMLAGAVNGLSNLDALIPILQGLGRKHVDYKVEKAHYDMVGLALLQALEAGLGDDFTPEVKGAWAEVYGVMASVMTEAAYK